ncbi:MAG: polymerase subunit gamma/tau [Verrucomicrobiaceae bacterium]|nr:polymerase subunit gamma/tau [Verrucomicrobiaceae bacterium]
MSYQVLARKWRPKIFREMVGQEHVLRALINALDHDRLHHAYLFTGTRGVGKTTIARILAKCLNCEVGVSSEPCGVCSACTEIAEGRFIDLIEVDAASRTKVEDTREILENVQYAPSRGRYKVYLIDEVHMLSTHSFNALLKTLEEPPPHVKFLLATTDPQKLPATILSRCLQFNLKNMTPERIVQHLAFVLGQEMVSFEEPALWLLGRAADGSMRDALSLTDQAIAFGSGKISEVDARSMLGTIDHGVVFELLDALSVLDGAALLGAVARIAEQATDFGSVLEELLAALHRIAIAQAVPDAVDNSRGDRERIVAFAAQFAAEDVQLFYQLGLNGRRDLPLAPDPRGGLEMVLLRMLAFKPQGIPQPPRAALGSPSAAGAEIAPAKKPEAPAAAPVAAAPTARVAALAAASAEPAKLALPAAAPARVEPPSPVPASVTNLKAVAPMPSAPSPVAPTPRPTPLSQQTPAPTPAVTQLPATAVIETRPIALDAFDNVLWTSRFPEFGVGGVVGTIAAHCCLMQRDGATLHFVLSNQHASFFDPTHTQRLTDQLSRVFATTVRVEITVGETTAETPSAYRERIRAERLTHARQLLADDANIHLLRESFGAELDENSIEPVDD